MAEAYKSPICARTRSPQLVLLQGDPHGAMPGNGSVLSLSYTNRCCNICNAPRGASASGLELPVPQQRHVALANCTVEETLPPPYLQALVGADLQELHTMGSAEEWTN